MRVSNDRVSSEGRVSFGRVPNESAGVDQAAQAQEPAEVIIYNYNYNHPGGWARCEASTSPRCTV
jgi:hypothetical protein